MPAQPHTPQEHRETLDLLAKHKTVSAAARAVGVPRPTMQSRVREARAWHAHAGLSPEEQLDVLHGTAPEYDLTHPIPSPLILRGTSSLYDDEGKLRLQWVKTKLDDERVEAAMRAAVEALAEGMPRAPETPAPRRVLSALCNLYTLTDCHIGMRAWAKETGDDWDLAIAERVLMQASDHLVESAPAAELGIINQLGDFLHFDSLAPITPTSGHLLDADSRYSKVVKVATKILRHVVDSALLRHKRVVVVISEGNHDMASAVWLRHLFGLLYENEPRVEVLDNESPYSCVVHGKVFLGFHHGHLTKLPQLPLIMAAQYSHEWGDTDHRYVHTGHKHTFEAKEFNGITLVQHPTMAGRDSYAARGGWLSERSMTAITYHAQHGQVASTTVVPEMLDSA